eukprot:scaffold11051_cov165-Amphora_coffeaeformis.AAC.13
MTANLSSVFEGAELRRQDHPQDFSNKTKLQWRWLIVIYTTADAYGADNYDIAWEVPSILLASPIGVISPCAEPEMVVGVMVSQLLQVVSAEGISVEGDTAGALGSSSSIEISPPMGVDRNCSFNC